MPLWRQGRKKISMQHFIRAAILGFSKMAALSLTRAISSYQFDGLLELGDGVVRIDPVAYLFRLVTHEHILFTPAESRRLQKA